MKTLRTLILIMLILQCTAYAYEGSDNSDRLSGASSSVFSPGYINAAKQKTESIMNQMYPQKSFMERLIENIKGGVADNVDKAADTKETVDIKKKTSSKETQNTAQANVIAVSGDGNIKIGTGENQEYVDGRLIAEFFDGKRNVYAGFDDIGESTINSAINYASNKYTSGGGESKVIVMGGRYYYEDINLVKVNGVSLFGGYNENGERDIAGTPSTISTSSIDIRSVTTKTEMNGFTIIPKDNIQRLRPFGTVIPTKLYITNTSLVVFDNMTFGYLDNNSSLASNASVLIKNSSFKLGSITTRNASIESNNNNYFNFQIIWRDDVTVLSDHDYFNSGGFINLDGFSVLPTNIAIQPNEQTPNLGNLNFTRGNQLSTILNPYDSRSPYDYGYDSSKYLNSIGKSGLILGLNKNSVSSIFKGLLDSKNDLSVFGAGQIDQIVLQKLVNKSLEESGLLAITDNSSKEMDLATILANILKSPTADQKLLIDATTNLLKGISEIEGEAGKSDELTKSENDLLQMAAAVLLTQGIPDLLKEGDVENMKGMFKDLGASKDKVLLDYKDSIKPYYNNIAKEIAANIVVLETKGIVKKLTEEQLKKLEPREIDRILENIRKSNDKSFELEYILQQDSKYRKEYLDPSKKLMEDNMKLILGSFAKKLSEALEEKR